MQIKYLYLYTDQIEKKNTESKMYRTKRFIKKNLIDRCDKPCDWRLKIDIWHHISLYKLGAESLTTTIVLANHNRNGTQ